MTSLEWVDYTYQKKHEKEDPAALTDEYFPNLKLYASSKRTGQQKSVAAVLLRFVSRYSKKALLSLAVYGFGFIDQRTRDPMLT